MRTFIDSLKDNPCTDCNQKFPPCVMDFDHRTNKKFGIADSTCRSKEQIMAEVEKCELVCANCHRIRTHKDKLPSWDDLE